MKLLIVLFFIVSGVVLAGDVNTVLESNLKENSLSTDAVLTFENNVSQKDIFLSYNKDLVIITVKNSILLKKQLYPKTTDKRILRTLVHSPVINRVDYRIRFKSPKFVKPELNEITVKKNKVIVKFFKSEKDMLLYHLQEEKKAEKKSEENLKILSTDNTKAIKDVKKSEEKEKIAKKEEKILKSSGKEEKRVSQKELMASPAYSFNPMIFIVLMFLGAIAFYLRKKNIEIESEGVKILSSKSIGNKKQLILVEADGNKLLLATSESGIQVLSAIDENKEEEPEYIPQKDKFKTKLDQEIDELEKSFFNKTKKNPYEKIENEPEVVTHFSKKLRNIKKL